MNNSLPIILFCVVALWETYLFLAQRVSLEISRANDIDQSTGRLMLPLWYLSTWPIRFAKYGLAIWIFLDSGFLMAISLLAAFFIVGVVIPIPHRHFIPMFERRLLRDISGGNSKAIQLYSAVLQTKKQLNMK